MHVGRGWIVALIVVSLLALPALGEGGVVFVKKGDAVVSVSLSGLPLVSGTVAYQGPVFDAATMNWEDPHTYTGVLISDLLAQVGGLKEGDLVSVVASDGYRKDLPVAVVLGETPAGRPILATGEVGADPAAWSSGLLLAFLAPDERFSNDDMLAAFGEGLSHYYSGRPSAKGFLVKEVTHVIVNYDGGPLPTEEEATSSPAAAAERTILTLVQGGVARSLTLGELHALDQVTGQGTFTNSAGVDYTATYTGVPFSTLLGSAPSDATVLVTATDGYSMNYLASQLLDRSTGTWVLAYEENGALMAADVGPLRIVLVGENNPHFEGAISARMVERIEVLGQYVEYTLVVRGAVTRTFTRAELEAGLGCPCHTATVTATMKGETHTYTGLPLWRLVAYVDDDRFPTPEQGIHYDDVDFNDALAQAGYKITLLAQDGYSQSVSSTLITHDDHFIVAFKRDGVFLDPATDGYMRFVYDDSVVLPQGTSLKSVKFLAEIRIGS
jgi:hypothetical protein